MRSDRQRDLTLGIILIFTIVFGLGWVNFQFAKNNPGGNDFLVHYVGTRAYLFEKLSPYSDEVATQIQLAAYGHPAQGIEHELRVAYPLYSIFLFAPFSIVRDYQLARAIWMTVLEIALVVMTFLALDLFDWKPSIWIQGLLLLFSLIWYHAVRGLINGNAVILIGLILTGVFYCIKNDKDRLAGIFLAVSTIKPHLVVLLIPLIIIWAFYKKRWQIIGWFFGWLGLLIVLSVMMIPNWILQNIWEILKYPAYNPAGTLAAAISEWSPGWGSQLKWGLGIVFGLVLAYEWWQSRKGDTNRLIWTGLLTMVISQWIGIQTDPGNFIMLFPALILILSVISRRWEEQNMLLTGTILALLLFGIWIIFLTTIQKSYQPIQSPVMFLPFPAFCLLGLYWVKWWVVGSKQLLWNEDL